MHRFTTLPFVLLLAVAGSARAEMRIGFIDPGREKELARHNAAAFAFARTVWPAARLPRLGVSHLPFQTQVAKLRRCAPPTCASSAFGSRDKQPFSRVLGALIERRQWGTRWPEVAAGKRLGNVMHRQRNLL